MDDGCAVLRDITNPITANESVPVLCTMWDEEEDVHVQVRAQKKAEQKFAADKENQRLINEGSVCASSQYISYVEGMITCLASSDCRASTRQGQSFERRS